MSSLHYCVEDYRQKLSNNVKGLSILHHKSQKITQHLETNSYLLSISYIFIQSFILSFVFDPSKVTCRNRRIPFYLSIVTAGIFGLNIWATISKYLNVKYEQEQNQIDQQENYQELVNLDNHKGNEDTYVVLGSPRADNMFHVYQRYVVHVWTTGVLLVAYTALVLYACLFSAC